MLVTFALVQATPAHIYKSFPPEHKAKALSKEKNVPPVPAPVTVAVQAETAPAPAVEPSTPVTDCGSDPLMAYIYRVESGCRTNAVNYIGCIGLGQACPGSKLPCSENDWNCQNDWFRNYAVQRYGSIYNAYLFRTENNWW